MLGWLGAVALLRPVLLRLVDMPSFAFGTGQSVLEYSSCWKWVGVECGVKCGYW